MTNKKNAPVSLQDAIAQRTALLHRMDCEPLGIAPTLHDIRKAVSWINWYRNKKNRVFDDQ
jgi:hypothetical protein